MQTATSTATYTHADIRDVVRQFRTDLTMIAESSGGWTASEVADRVHDVELLAIGGYLDFVDVTLSSGGIERSARCWTVDTDAGGLKANRPGGVIWPRYNDAVLRMTLGYTDDYDDAARAAISKKQSLVWSPTNRDISHSSLQADGGRNYASNGYGLQRRDWN